MGVFMGEKWRDDDGIWHDETGIANVILLSAWRGRVEYPDLRKMAQRLARDYLDDDMDKPRKYGEGLKPLKPDIILVEQKVSGFSLIQDLRRAGVMAMSFKPDQYGDKIQRVKIVTDLIENGRVWVPGQPFAYLGPRRWAQEVVDQLAAFPAMESRDYVDALTQALLRLKQGNWVINTENPPQEPPLRERGYAMDRY
jgi:predicted phage terminase large subunit-like protein